MTPTIDQADSTYTIIEKKVRRLTASASEAALSSADIQNAINTFYSQDFPYAIKIDQQRQVYKFLTIPNVDRYPVDVNNLQGFRAPVYFEGRQGNFFKNRDQLFNLYPRNATQFTEGITTLSGTITLIKAGVITGFTVVFSTNTLLIGDKVQFSNVVGSVELNGNIFTVTDVSPSAFEIDILYSSLTPYISGGTWISASSNLSFSLFGNNVNAFPAPNAGILSTQVVIGGIDINGNSIRIIDDGGAVVNSYGIGSNTTTGKLIYVTQNNVGNNVYLNNANAQLPAIPPLSPLPIPSPPTPITPQYCGTVDYVTTQINLNLPITPMPGNQLIVWAATYQPGRPYNMLFWNNEITIRP